MKDFLIRTRRYLLYLIQYFFYEKPRGLDFTMRDTTLLRESGGVYHGYCKTNAKHLKDIFGRLENGKELNFLDVGSGKGAVLREAARYYPPHFP